MKRQVIFFTTVVCFFLAGLIPCYGGERADISFMENGLDHAFKSEHVKKLKELMQERKRKKSRSGISI